MDAQLMDALADILADALLTDIEAEMESEHAVPVATAGSPRGTGSRKDQDEHLAISSPASNAAHSSNPSDPIVVSA
jgi:hypothetical protein